MRDFDYERRDGFEREFKLNDHVFRVRRGVRPEDLISWEDAVGSQATLDATDDLIKKFLAGPDDVAAYEAARANLDEPLTLDDLRDLVDWLISNETEVPTSPPSSSGPGETSGEAESKAGSSSREETPTA